MWSITHYLVIGHAPRILPGLSSTWHSHYKGTFVPDINTASFAVSTVPQTRRPREANSNSGHQNKTVRAGVPSCASSWNNQAWDGRFRLPGRNSLQRCHSYWRDSWVPWMLVMSHVCGSVDTQTPNQRSVGCRRGNFKTSWPELSFGIVPGPGSERHSLGLTSFAGHLTVL